MAATIAPEHTVDFFPIATARVGGNDLAAVRRTLRHEPASPTTSR